VTTDTAGAPETIQYYVVYRGETANFVPTIVESLGATSGIDFPDSTVSFSPAEEFYYLVRAVDTANNKSAESARVGEFNRELLRYRGEWKAIRRQRLTR
jgi:hypothetical protein